MVPSCAKANEVITSRQAARIFLVNRVNVLVMMDDFS
jgi:hypothetical protein